MTKKKILIVSRNFYPINSPRSFRTTELAKEFSRQGHYVTVLLPKNLESESLLDFAALHQIAVDFYGPLKCRKFDKSKIIGDWSRKLNRLLFLLFEYPNIEIYFKLPKYLKSLDERYDLLLSIAVPHENHWAVAKVQSKYKIANTWVADCGDPFMGNQLERISPPFYFKYLENYFLSQADFITVPTEGSILAYNSDYQSKFRVIPQGFDFTNVQLAPYLADPSKICFAYAGGISQSGIRSPHQLIAYLMTKTALAFEFHIYSNQVDTLSTLALQSQGKIVLHNGIPREQLLQELSKMDFLINLDNGASTATPSKLIDYGLTGRPILNISPFEPDEQKIDAFLNGDYTAQYVLDGIERYNIVTVAEQFLSLLDEK